MKILLVAIVWAMILKDVLPLGDVYIMRGVSQVAALLFGMFLIVTCFSMKVIKRNALVVLYVLMLFLSILWSPFKEYSFLQVVSLLSPICFFLGINQRHTNIKGWNIGQLFFKNTLFLYLAVCIISIAYWMINPASVQQVVWGGEIRFTGLFNEPGMMGLSAGLLVGLAMLSRGNILIKLLCIGAGLICMYLTLSRTFVVALSAALFVTSWLYFPKHRKIYLGLACFAIVAFILKTAINYQVKVDQNTVDGVIRTDSISNLSGRLSLWERVLGKRADEPFNGEGFSMGGIILMERHGESIVGGRWISDPREVGRTTLHSGYIQALADLGWAGLVLYILVIYVGLWRIISRDKQREFPVEFFVMVYMPVANVAESVIYTASNFPSILFWYAAIFAMSLPKPNKRAVRGKRDSKLVLGAC